MAEHPVGVEILSSDECWALLNQQRLGRLAVATSGDVDIFPINFFADAVAAPVLSAAAAAATFAGAPEAAFAGNYLIDSTTQVARFAVTGATLIVLLAGRAGVAGA
ncbi:pyridoxamine 5'-phosphate oxidase family protein [Microbacterium lacticum]